MPEAVAPVRTTCPYCGVGCGLLVSREAGGADWSVRGDPAHPANHGRLCSKGAALAETLSLDDRLLHPLVDGRRVSWASALDTVAGRFARVVAEHGPDAVAFYVSGQLLSEDYYVANKLMKGFIGSANIDTNSRLCMASAVAGHKRAFGCDAVPGCYEDLEIADLVVLAGSNAAWTHPVAFQRLTAARKARPAMRVVAIDPRRTATSELADINLAIRPGTDSWLFNGLMQYLKKEDAIAWRYVEQHVEGFGATLEAVAGLSIAVVAQRCGLAESDVAAFYRLFATTPRTVTVFSQGINQSSSGVDKVNSIINVHLATGRIGLPGATPFSITGQPNAMGGREVGGLANQLASHMDFTPEALDRVGRFWQAPGLASQPGLKALDLFDAIADGRIKAVWIMATNPVVSLPEADRVLDALKRCEFVVVSEVVAETDTSACAHVLLPAAAWGEKEGTVTNSERRISRQRAFMAPPGEARPDWWIVAEVAKCMGYGAQFDYAGPAEIFREYASLCSFENDGRRDLDLSALANLDTAAYDAVAPVQWPVREAGGTARLFADGRFFTPSGRACMLPIAPRQPAHAADPGHPLVLNSGRIRDQWHTMTRTGKAAKLLTHLPEPFIEIHPDDARRHGLCHGELAQVDNDNGTFVGRVQESADQQAGSVFAPIHWNRQYASQARVNALVHAVADPISGQPEFKQTPVAVRPYGAAWQGFILVREGEGFKGRPATLAPQPSYGCRVRARHCWRHEIAGFDMPTDWPAYMRDALDLDGDWMAIRDPGAGRYRGALIRGKRLIALYFIERDAARLPSRQWLESLFETDTLDPGKRTELLLGRPAKATPDAGHIVCACFGVGEPAIRQAIAGGAKSVEELGTCLKAGTNCGSCLPELKRLLVDADSVTPAGSRVGYHA
jgi:assimilatory nitrate reductase catalytic subunit